MLADRQDREEFVIVAGYVGLGNCTDPDESPVRLATDNE